MFRSASVMSLDSHEARYIWTKIDKAQTKSCTKEFVYAHPCDYHFFRIFADQSGPGCRPHEGFNVADVGGGACHVKVVTSLEV